MGGVTKVDSKPKERAMKSWLRLLVLAGLALWGVIGLRFRLAEATLVGDTVSLAHHCCTLGTVFHGPFNVEVKAGDSDRTVLSGFLGFAPTYGVNVESSSILVDFVADIGFSPFAFHGLVASSLDWVGMPEGKIVGVTVSTNLGGFDTSRVSFGDHVVRVHWGGLFVPSGTTFNLTLRTTDTVIPEPGTLLLLGAGLAGFSAIAWNRHRRM
jgi:hypothetical protein